MKQVIEYVVQNYAWFLGGIILILLAIVGYYADKTNFGQGKSDKSKKDNLENDELSNLADSVEGNLEGIYEPLEDNSQLKELNEQVIQTGNIVTNLENQNDTTVNSDIINVNNPSILEETTSNVFNKEEVDKFNDEFNSILPEKELISTDLLSDIEDLELDKTQKIDLNDLSDLNNIELPKIKKFVSEEEDIWKF